MPAIGIWIQWLLRLVSGEHNVLDTESLSGASSAAGAEAKTDAVALFDALKAYCEDVRLLTHGILDRGSTVQRSAAL